MLHRSKSLVPLVILGAVLAGCGQPGSARDSTSPPVEGDVQVLDNDFEPENLEVAVGDAVTWVWEGRAAHDVVGEGFDSGVQSEGTFEHSFDEPGTYDYECTLHAGMTGQITVVDE